MNIRVIRWTLLYLLFGYAFLQMGRWHALYANPYFLLQGDGSGVMDTTETISLYLDTDGDTVTAAQTVISFSPTYLTGVSINNLGSKCTFWAPADPSLGYGSRTAPYFKDSNKVVISCGFSNPGYLTGSSADLIARISFNPEASGSTSLSFSNSTFRYIGTTISSGATSNYGLNIYESTSSAQANATPTPTSAGGSSSSSSGSSSSSSNQNLVIISDPTDSLSAADLNFYELSSTAANNQLAQAADGTALQAIESDNSIPAPPDLTPRPTRSPFPFTSDFGAEADAPNQAGEVLSVTSLRELLIPGKSPADKTVVLVNFISTLTFLILISIALWRMITISRLNKVKYKHMQDILSGELSAMQSKLGAIDSKKDNSTADLKQSFEELMKTIAEEKEGKK